MFNPCSKTARNFYAVFFFTLLAASCGGGGGSDPTDPGTNPTGLEITRFQADQTILIAGESTTLTAVFPTGTGEIDNGVGTVVSGTPITVTPSATVTYKLTVTDGQNNTNTATTTINVESPALFHPTSIIGTGREMHCATLLKNGTVLVTGGYGLASAEIFDPQTGQFTSTTASMSNPRRGHTATLLPDGTVLIAGGDPTTSGNTGTTDTADIYNPATGTFSATGNMTIGHYLHTATLLDNGKVLIAGGLTGGVGSTSDTNIAELYDPVAKTFTQITNTMNVARRSHTAVLLNNNKVLLAGGSPSQTTELFDPQDNTFTATGSMTTIISDPVATKLPDGTVLVQSGASAEIYDPDTGLFAETGSPIATVYPECSTLLANGRVLILGSDSSGLQAVTALYNPITKTFSATANNLAHYYGSLSCTRLQNDQILVVGPYYSGGVLQGDGSELYW